MTGLFLSSYTSTSKANMSSPRYRIQGASPSSMHIPPSFMPNRQYLPHFNGPFQHARPRVINQTKPFLKKCIEASYYGLPTAYGLPGELLDFDYYSKFIEKPAYNRYPHPEYGPPQRTWQDVDAFCKANDVSTEFSQNYTRPEPTKGFSRHSLPTDETFVSEYDSEHDYESSSDEQGGRQGSNRNWRNAQYDSEATSSDEESDDSSEYYDSDSEDEWSFPPRFQSNPLPSGLTLKEAVLSYEQRWNSMLTQRSNHQLTFETVPWPQYPPPRSPAEVNYRSIREFLRAAGGSSSFMLKTIFRQTMLRFHPDKSAVLLAHVDERQRRLVFEGCTAVTRCLNDIRDLF